MLGMELINVWLLSFNVKVTFYFSHAVGWKAHQNCSTGTKLKVEGHPSCV